MFTLRQYQQKANDKVTELFRSGKRSVLLVSPTGSGKTVLVANMLGTAAQRKRRSLFLVHRRELVKQAADSFKEAGVPFGVVAAGWPERKGHPIQIASVQTLSRRLNHFPLQDFIIYDEAHHTAAASWSKIREHYASAFHLGVTATPERLDGTGLGKWFSTLVQGPTTKQLIEEGWLCPYRLFAPAGVDLSGVKKRGGDFAAEGLTALLDKPTITGSAIKEYLKLTPGKRAVVFCSSVEHSKHVAEQFRQAGVSSAHIDGETNPEERDRLVSLFRRGEILVLCNVELFGEGFDLPAIETAILLRPTQSLGLYLQQVGRSLRPYDGKTCATILDHAGNCQRHGLPDDERTWSLDGTASAGGSTGGENIVSVRICRKCAAAVRAGVTTCPFCGTEFPVTPRRIQEVEGELIEMTPEQILKAKQIQAVRDTKSLDYLIQMGKARGYKNPHAWAHYIVQARQARRLSEGQTNRLAKFESQR